MKKPAIVMSSTQKDLMSRIEALRFNFDGNKQWNNQVEQNALLIVCEIYSLIHKQKSATYKDSWKKRGWIISIFGNISRKFDRMEKIFIDVDLFNRFINHPDPNEKEESFADTLADSGVYNILAMTELMLTKPDVFDKWYHKNVKITSL